MKIPGHPMTVTATPSDYDTIRLLGGESYNGVTVTHDQLQNIRRIYGMTKEGEDGLVSQSRAAHAVAEQAKVLASEKQNSWGPKPDPPKTFDEKGTRQFIRAGDNLTALRFAQRDGMRVMALLAKHLEMDEDPVRVVARLLAQGGWDVDSCTIAWADDEAPQIDVEVDDEP